MFTNLIYPPPQHRAYVAKMQPIWDAEKAAAAAKANRENMVSRGQPIDGKATFDSLYEVP